MNLKKKYFTIHQRFNISLNLGINFINFQSDIYDDNVAHLQSVDLFGGVTPAQEGLLLPVDINLQTVLRFMLFNICFGSPQSTYMYRYTQSTTVSVFSSESESPPDHPYQGCSNWTCKKEKPGRDWSQGCSNCTCIKEILWRDWRYLWRDWR